MTIYNFHEIIGLLRDDNDLMFETKNKNKIGVIHGALKISHKDSWEPLIIDSDMLNGTYIAIPPQVNFTIALQAWLCGRTIKLTKVDNTTKQLRNYKITSDMDNFEFNLNDLKHGTWRILE